MTKIYIVRHAEAEGNIFLRTHGQYDSLLTVNAPPQLEALRKRFENIHVDAVYSSDLYRTCETVRPIAESHGLRVRLCTGLREISFGEWEDMAWGHIPRLYPELYYRWDYVPWDIEIPGGETGQQLAARVTDALKNIAAECPGMTVVAASHGAAIRYALCAMLGMPFERVDEVGWCDNTAVSLVEAEGDSLHVVFHSDTSHIDDSVRVMRERDWIEARDRLEERNMWYDVCSGERQADFLNMCSRAGICSDELSSKGSLGFVAMLGDTPRGIIAVSVCENVGEIDAFFVEPELIEKGGPGFGYQVIGKAVSVCRNMGCIRLDVKNAEHPEYFRNVGFTGEDSLLSYNVKVPELKGIFCRGRL